jgi:flagellar FliL protein
MSSRDSEKDVEEGQQAPQAGKQKSDLVRLVIPGAVAIFIAVLGAQVAAPMLTQMISGDHAPRAAHGEGEEGHAEGEAGADGEEIEVAAIEPAIYVPLDPPLVVSFAAEGGTRFLQLTLQAMARNEHAIDAVKQHSPALRNAFLFLLSGRSVDDLLTLQGKESLRADMTAKAQEILTTNTGEPGIEELYFTSFVVQ